MQVEIKSFLIIVIFLDCEEDTREDWANLSWKAESCLMTGGGIGADYSVYRAEGKDSRWYWWYLLVVLLPKMQMINEIGQKGYAGWESSLCYLC